jgi:hypothetical protein
MWILSSAPYYTYQGIGPGATMSAASAQFPGGRSAQYRGEQLYVIRQHRMTVVFGASHGLIDEIGVLNTQFVQRRGALSAVLQSLR